MIRVGKIVGKHNPEYKGYEPIIVKTKSDRSYWELSPYYLKYKIPEDPKREGIVEDLWQGSKAYRQVYHQKQIAKWNSKLILWEHPSEIHIDKNNDITPEYWKWRMKLMTNPHPVRYPVGYYGRKECVCSIWPNEKGQYECLDYITARKKIYCHIYGEAAKIHPRFLELREKLKHGKNLLILDVDGPKYTNKSPFNRVENESIEVNEMNIKELLNDPSQPFGHGYVLAVYLLGKEEWLK